MTSRDRGRCRKCGKSHLLTKAGTVVAHRNGANPDCPGKGLPPRTTDPTWQDRALLAEGVLKLIGEIPSHRGQVPLSAIRDALEVLDQ